MSFWSNGFTNTECQHREFILEKVNSQYIAWIYTQIYSRLSFTILHIFSSNAFSVYFVQYIVLSIVKENRFRHRVFSERLWAGALNFLFHHIYLTNRQVNMFYKQPRYTIHVISWCIFYTFIISCARERNDVTRLLTKNRYNIVGCNEFKILIFCII